MSLSLFHLLIEPLSTGPIALVFRAVGLAELLDGSSLANDLRVELQPSPEQSRGRVGWGGVSEIRGAC